MMAAAPRPRANVSSGLVPERNFVLGMHVLPSNKQKERTPPTLGTQTWPVVQAPCSFPSAAIGPRLQCQHFVSLCLTAWTTGEVPDFQPDRDASLSAAWEATDFRSPTFRVGFQRPSKKLVCPSAEGRRRPGSHGVESLGKGHGGNNLPSRVLCTQSPLAITRCVIDPGFSYSYFFPSQQRQPDLASFSVWFQSLRASSVPLTRGS